MDDTKDLKDVLDNDSKEILKNFYSDKMNPESRKFMLLMISKFLPINFKKDALKRLIDTVGDKGVDEMFNAYLDLFCTDQVAEMIRDIVDEQ